MRLRWSTIVMTFVLAACTTATDSTEVTDQTTVSIAIDTASTVPASTTTSTAVPDTTTTTEATLIVEPVPFDGLALPTTAGSHFSTSGACASCHTNMFDNSGDDVSIDSTWRSSMMANAARDPYWLATVQSEAAANPELAAVIEDKCSICHMPMARTTDAFSAQGGVMFGDGYLNSDNEMHVLATDGVSCTVCHQIDPANLGTVESFSGGFLIDPATSQGERVTYGPFPASRQAVEIMQGVSGFIPAEGRHIQESQVCGTCHTLYTPFVDSAGAVAGLFPEQTALLELEAGNVNRSCQSCHMPIIAGQVEVSTIAGEPRSDVNRHLFVGGNEYMMSVFSLFGEDLELTASSDQVMATRAGVRDQLSTDTATIALSAVDLEAHNLGVTVYVHNATGHKLPTGYPSRRVWIHLRVLDRNGDSVFESGAWQSNGAIVGNDNDTDPTRYEPHYDSITSADQVQVYETILANTDGDVTTTLLRGAEYAKDNRLLPQGFDKLAVPADIGVFGAALDDASFGGAGDEVAYRIEVDPNLGPFTIEAELLYQSVSYRWAENLDPDDGSFIEDFKGYYEAVPNVPSIIARTTSP